MGDPITLGAEWLTDFPASSLSSFVQVWSRSSQPIHANNVQWLLSDRSEFTNGGENKRPQRKENVENVPRESNVFKS